VYHELYQILQRKLILHMPIESPDYLPHGRGLGCG
jgi:hypothetical protein